MQDRIPIIIGEIKARRVSAAKKFKKIEDEHEFVSSLVPFNRFHENRVKRNLRMLEDAIRTDEKIVLCERRLYNSYIELLGYTSEEEKHGLRSQLAESEIENLGIVTGYTEDGWVYVRAPGFLPAAGDAWLSKEFFAPVEDALSRLNPERVFFRERCCIATVQNIERGTKRQITDADNREYRDLNNMIARNFLWDDNPMFCDFFLASIFKDTSYVEAFIIPMRDMPEFLRRLQSEDVTPKILLEKIV